MRQLLVNYDVTATATTGTLSWNRLAPWAPFVWTVTMPSGSGTNQVAISALVIGNVEADAVTEVTFTLSDMSAWNGPKIITDNMVTNATSTTYKFVHSLRSQWERIRLTFTYSGGGTRTFRFNLWGPD